MAYVDSVKLTIAVQHQDGTFATTPEDFSCDVTGANLTPDTPIESKKYLCGPKTTVGAATWTLSLDYDQDWTGTGLSTFLNANAGKQAQVVLDSPLLGAKATCEVTLVPGPYGGAAGETAEGSVEFGVTGQPVFSAATPATQAAKTTK